MLPQPGDARFQVCRPGSTHTLGAACSVCAAAQPLTYGGALREEREVGVVWVGLEI